MKENLIVDINNKPVLRINSLFHFLSIQTTNFDDFSLIIFYRIEISND